MSTAFGRMIVGLLGQYAGQPIGGWHDQRRELVERHGTVSAAARAAGIPRRTWRYWDERIAAGKEPSPKSGTRDLLRSAVQRGRTGDIPTDSGVVIHVTDRDSGRERSLDGAHLKLAAGTMEAVAEEYRRTGEPDAAGARFIEGVGVSFYRGYLTPSEGDDDEDDQDDEEDYGGSAEYYYDQGAPAAVFGSDYRRYRAKVAA